MGSSVHVVAEGLIWLYLKTQLTNKTIMKKLILSFVMLVLGITCYGQISMPSTYTYTKKVFGYEDVSHITNYFIFRSANEVIWCIESSDSFLYPVAFGKYDAYAGKLIFTKQHSRYAMFVCNDPIVFKVTMSGGKLGITPLSSDLKNFFEGDERAILTKCDYNLTPSSKLVGTSWKYENYETNEKVTLYFKTKTQVLWDGEPRGYILINDTIGILSGDNPEDEAVVGYVNSNEMSVHRRGYSKSEHSYQITLKKVN